MNTRHATFVQIKNIVRRTENEMCEEYFYNTITRFKVTANKKVCHDCYKRLNERIKSISI